MLFRSINIENAVKIVVVERLEIGRADDGMLIGRAEVRAAEQHGIDLTPQLADGRDVHLAPTN